MVPELKLPESLTTTPPRSQMQPELDFGCREKCALSPPRQNPDPKRATEVHLVWCSTTIQKRC